MRTSNVFFKWSYIIITLLFGGLMVFKPESVPDLVIMGFGIAFILEAVYLVICEFIDNYEN